MGLAVFALVIISPSAQLDRSTAIEQMLERGELDAEQAAIYQLYSLRQPELLPPAVRDLPPQHLQCGTSHFLRAYQMRERGELSDWGRAGYKQGTPRPTSAGYYDSSTYPIRVHYTRAALDSRAASILTYTEYSWTYQVGAVGWTPPIGDYGGGSEGGSNDLDIYVGDAYGAGGLTVPEGNWSATPNSDCTSFVIISENIIDGGDLMTTVAHEFNHVVQAAYDCMEWIAFWENTASYMMDLTYDNVDDYIYMLPSFQMNPHLPFEYHEPGGGFQYGASIVPRVIDEAYGNSDGVAVRRVWELSTQTNPWDNEPDYFDAIPQVMAEYGDSSGMDGFMQTLTEWRYLAGTRDDGYHMSEAADWATYCGDQCEPPNDREYNLSNLPVVPSPNNEPYMHGSTYTQVNIGSTRTGLLRIDFAGENFARWGLNVICVGTGPASVINFPVSAAGQASGQVQASGTDYCTLAVSNLGLTNYDPDDDFTSIAQQTYDYTVSINFIEGAIPAPTISTINPSKIPCVGASDVTITGTNFVQGLVVQMGGDLPTVTSVTPTSVVVTPQQRSESGAAIVVVINPDDQRASKANGLLFTGNGCYCSCDATYECDADCSCDPECGFCECDTTLACDADCDCDPECELSGGCGCTVRERATREPALGLLVVALLLLRIRRSRA